MGEDIHCKWYIKSKVGSKSGKYVSAIEVMPSFNTELDHQFKDLIQERYEDLFSMFGSNVSDWRRLECLNEGLPDWHVAEFPTENAMLKLKGNNYYHYSWTTLKDLLQCLSKRMNELLDPITYYNADPDEDLRKQMIFLLTEDRGTLEAKSFIGKWKNDAENLRAFIEHMIASLKGIQKMYANLDYNAIFDVDESVILFWFDC